MDDTGAFMNLSALARRQGYTSLSLLAILALAAFMTGKIYSHVSQGREAAEGVISVDTLALAARFAIVGAEDWLLGSIAAGAVPRSRKDPAADFEEYIAAVLPGGARADYATPFAGIGVEVFVAEAFYDAALFTDIPAAVPSIPEEISAGGTRLHYLLRSTATSAAGRPGIVCEELLAVTFVPGGLIDAERVFFRSMPK